MPDYQIEDTQTGIKLEVSGNAEPTQNDAHELVSNELRFLSTNLFTAPGGRFLLDVGPTKENREIYDRLTPVVNDANKTLGNKEPIQLTSTDQILNNLPENTLFIVAHGSKEGGFATDEGHKFTLHNVAQILGPQTNDVKTIVNAACYGGKCEPKDYETYFPSVAGVAYGQTNSINSFMLKDLREGNYFTPEITPNYWSKSDQGWIRQARPIP